MVKQIDLGSEVEQAIGFSIPFDATDQAVSGQNADAVLTLAADSERPICLTQVICGYSASPTGGSVKIEDGAGNTVFGPIGLTGTGPHIISFDPPRCGTKNTNMIITLAAGGGTVVGTVWANAHKLY